MQFGFLGIDYKNADLTIRDEISFTDQKKLEFFHKADEIGIEQVMILSVVHRLPKQVMHLQRNPLFSMVSRFLKIEFSKLSR